MKISKIGLYGVLVFGFMSSSGNGIAQEGIDTKLFGDSSADCRDWGPYGLPENSNNQIYFNNVFGQYGAYPMLDPYPVDLPYPSWDKLPETKQCVWQKDNVSAGWTYDWPEITDKSSGTQRYAVKAFPEVIYGIKGESDGNANKVSGSVTGFPLSAAEVLENKKLIDVEFSYSEYLANEVGRNVTIESFFHDVDGDCSKIRADNRSLEIMIWTERPSDEFTITDNLYAQGVSIEGYSWNVYWRKFPQDYIVFEATTPFSGRDIVSPTNDSSSSAQGAYNWNEFVKYVYDNQQGLNVTFDSDFCMAGLEFGTEIWFGKGEFRINNYAVDVYDGITDADNDGVFDKQDSCPNTSEMLEISLGSCNTGVANVVQANGCSIVDELSSCDVNSFKNQGQYRKCISGKTNTLKRGLLTGREKGAIQRCAARGR